MRMRFLQRMKAIEEIMDEDNTKNMNKFQNSSIDITKFFNFNMRLIDFEITLSESSHTHILFWKELLENKVSLEELNRRGSMITQEKEEIREEFEEMVGINSKNSKLLELYCDFLVLVCHDNENARAIRDKASFLFIGDKSNSGRSIIENKYSANSSDTGIIIISGT